MKLITKNAELGEHLVRLVSGYPNVAFAVAWASKGTRVLEALKNGRPGIQRAVIGTHFWQTHPDVVDTFVESESVRFVLQPLGVFHPKIFMFWDARHWEILIGSANLTIGALTHNSETMVLLSDTDQIGSPLKQEVLTLIEGYWNRARKIGKSEADSYRALWLRQQPRLSRLSGAYGGSTVAKPPTESTVMSMPWQAFFNKVKADPHHGFENRCELLRIVREHFASEGEFRLMDRGIRKVIAGLPNDVDERWAWFGSMRGAGRYHRAVNDNSVQLSAALDEIPLKGPVSRQHYDEYTSKFLKAFPSGGHGIAVATRLLAMKRSDYFVCFDAKNRRALCRDFGVRHSGMSYERYWGEIVERILDAPWWNASRPHDKVGQFVWESRAAMLDAIFYEP